MNNSFEVTFNLDLTETIDILSDYYGVTIPSNILMYGIVAKSGQLFGEVIDGSIGDTCARELLIREVIRSLPDNKGMEWPCYGTSDAESEKFYAWFSEAIKTVGGTFGE